MAYEKRFMPIDLQPDVAVGVKLPLVSKSGQLFDLSYSTEEQAISNIKNLLFTSKGERIMQPQFGTKLPETLFEPNDDVLKERISMEISDAIDFWLPYISITKLNIETVIAVGESKEEHGVTISLQVAINGQESEIPITFLVTADGAQEI